MSVFKPVEHGVETVGVETRMHGIRPGRVIEVEKREGNRIQGMGQVDVFNYWEVVELEALLKQAIRDLRKLGMDEIAIPWFALERFSKNSSQSIFTIKQLVKVLKKDLRDERVVRVSWKDGYLYVMWY